MIKHRQFVSSSLALESPPQWPELRLGLCPPQVPLAMAGAALCYPPDLSGK